MASTIHLTLVLLCLVVSHAHGSSRVVRWSDDSADVSPSTTSCPSLTSGHTNGNKLPVVHRLSRCSPLAGGGARKHGKPSLHEILHRDGLRLRYLSQVRAATAAAAAAPAPSPAATVVAPPLPAAAPAPSPAATVVEPPLPAANPPTNTPASGLSVPATPNVVANFPGLFEYTVLAGYGTPAQQLNLRFDVSGLSYIRCKPCFSPSSQGLPCDAGFDTSMSSSFRNVPCGSPDCGYSCSAGGSCSTTLQNSTLVFGNGTMVMDTLTLSPSSATFENFVALCVHLDNDVFTDNLALGSIDLSLSPQSLATRVVNSSPPGTAAFSYCLPADTDTHGFLTIAPALSDYSAHAGVKYVPLVTNPNGPNAYYVDLVAIAINGKDLLLPPALFRDNGTMIDSQAAFTYLNPPIYAALRDEFRKEMAQYPPAPAFSDLDTCYNFTLTEYINLPNIAFRFGNGETMDLDDRQFMYFFREHLTDGFPFGCLAFAATPGDNFYSFIGTQVQRTKEIVYDIRGGKVAFVPSRCGLR